MNRLLNTVAASLLVIMPLYAQADAIAELEAEYRAQGVSSFSAVNGEALWNKDFVDAKTAETRNCASCHGKNLIIQGSHITTNKVIDPMALSANPGRYSEVKKINKWFLRNCKWTMGRECTSQEKGDFLAFLKNL